MMMAQLVIFVLVLSELRPGREAGCNASADPSSSTFCIRQLPILHHTLVFARFVPFSRSLQFSSSAALPSLG
ncbi:hypothetical protein J3F83DRAFT_723833 [Trichoderma novae-zelandiae]